MDFTGLLHRASKFTVDNSPTIMTAVGVVGAVTTAYLAGKASFEAADMIRLKEGTDDERGVTVGSPREVAKERVQLVWKLYIPAMTTCVATVTCIIAANRVGSRKAAGLAAAYTITEKTFEEYKAKVVEKIGERKEAAVHDEIVQDRVARTYLDDVTVYGADAGELCYDSFSDRYFRNTVEGIRAAENALNYALIHENYATLDVFYESLGLPSPAYAHTIGWNSDRMLEVRVTSALTNDKPVIAISFKNDPLPDYGRFH